MHNNNPNYSQTTPSTSPSTPLAFPPPTNQRASSSTDYLRLRFGRAPCQSPRIRLCQSIRLQASACQHIPTGTSVLWREMFAGELGLYRLLRLRACGIIIVASISRDQVRRGGTCVNCRFEPPEIKRPTKDDTPSWQVVSSLLFLYTLLHPHHLFARLILDTGLYGVYLQQSG